MIRYVRPDKRPSPGDLKVVKGVGYVRKQVYSKRYQAWFVRHGRPVCEWVRVDD